MCRCLRIFCLKDTGVFTPLFSINAAKRRSQGQCRHMSEPIAIIGAACRFPGRVTSLEKYWTLLEQGVDAVTKRINKSRD